MEKKKKKREKYLQGSQKMRTFAPVQRNEGFARASHSLI